MIEIEIFQRHMRKGVSHNVRVWINGILVYDKGHCKEKDLIYLRDHLANELRWLDDYLENKK